MLTAKQIAELLGLGLPVDATPAELTEWAGWWRESAELAQNMTPEEIAYRKAGGWWPIATVRHVLECAPLVVRCALRPNLNSSPPQGADFFGAE